MRNLLVARKLMLRLILVFLGRPGFQLCILLDRLIPLCSLVVSWLLFMCSARSHGGIRLVISSTVSSLLTVRWNGDLLTAVWR